MKKVLILNFLILAFTLNSQFLPYGESTSDGDEIPYGLADVDFGLFYSHYVNYAIGQVATVDGSIPQISKNQSGNLKGIGFNINAPILYWFLYKDNSRFKIVDDFGLGMYGLQGFGMQIHAGVRSFFRINDLVDVGAQYYPFYRQTDWKDRSGVDIGESGFKRGFGFHLRVASFYLDYNSIKTNKFNYYDFENHYRFNSIKIKFLYDDDPDAPLNNVSVTIGAAKLSNETKDAASYGPVYKEFSDSKNKYLFVNLCWSTTF